MIKLKQIGLIFSVLFLLSCGEDAEKEVAEETPSSYTLDRNPLRVVADENTEVEVYDFENFKPFLEQTDDKIHVINFWATWCIPCVAELPYFQQLHENYPAVEITLVSLDFPSKIEARLLPFMAENELPPDVILLDEPNGNKWIPQVDENWSGAIPATVIYKGDQHKFYEQSFTYEELEQEVLSF